MPSLDIVIPAFNAARVLAATLEAVAAQGRPAGLDVGVIVVNNGSTDTTAAVIDSWADAGVRRVDYDRIQSRSAARNAGVAASNADYVLLLDADCRLIGSACLETIAEAIRMGAAAGFGFATGETDSFWGRYHHNLEIDRNRARWLGWTTQCCFVARDLFNRVEGFAEAYRHYGFEDRDFFCKLRDAESAEKLVTLEQLRVLHDPDTSIREICAKMFESGRYSSGVFRRNFPDVYRALPYAKVDVSTASGASVGALHVLRVTQPLLLAVTATVTRGRSTPLWLGRPLVRLCSAASYFAGTLARERDNR